MLKQQKCDNVKQIEIIIDDEFSGDVMCFDLCFTTFRLILPPPSLGLIGPRKVLYDPQTQFAIPSSTAAPNITPISGQFRTVPAAARCCRFQHVQTQTNVSHSACVLHRRSGFDGLQAAYGNIPISGTGNCLNYCEIFIIYTNVGARGGALRYKPEGGGFDSRWCHWNFLLTSSFQPQYGGLSLQQK